MHPGGFEGFDRISLTGIRGHGFHGVLPFERQNGQQFVVDVVLHAEIRQAGRTDALADTIDYAAVSQCIYDAIVGEPVNLIESLAQQIADGIFALGDQTQVPVSMVEVTVHKPQAPVPVDLDDVAVSIVRVR